MKQRIMCMACLAVCVCFKGYSQPSREQIQRNLEAAIAKGLAEKRAKERQEAEAKARVREQTKVQTQRRVNNIQVGNQYLQQNTYADEYKKGPAGKQLTNAEVATKKNQGIKNKDSVGVRSWPTATQPQNNGIPSGGNYIQEGHKKFMNAKKFKKPNAGNNELQNQGVSQSYIPSTAVNENYGANNPQGKTSSDEHQRANLPPQVVNKPNPNAQPNTQRDKQPNKTNGLPENKNPRAKRPVVNSNQTSLPNKNTQGKKVPSQQAQTQVALVPAEQKNKPKQSNSLGNAEKSSGDFHSKDVSITIKRAVDSNLKPEQMIQGGNAVDKAYAANKLLQEGLMDNDGTPLIAIIKSNGIIKSTKK